MPGANESKTRAEAVSKRRIAAAAHITDLNTEFEDLKLALEMEANEYQQSDFLALKTLLGSAQKTLENLFRDVNEINSRPVPERISEPEAFQLVQPALWIENRSIEMYRQLEEFRNKKAELDRPLQTAAVNLETAQRRRLQIEAVIEEARIMVENLSQAKAETFPQVYAALSTAGKEVFSGQQLVDGARQALLRKAYREAEDLALRSVRLFDSAGSKLDLIRLSSTDFSNASQQAEASLSEAMQLLNEAKTRLTSYTSQTNTDSNSYFQAAIQRIGEARRAIKSNPPQFLACLRLSREAITLINETVGQVSAEAERLKILRVSAQNGLEELLEVLQLARLTLNSQISVPVKANELYSQARNERDSLLEQSRQINQLGSVQLGIYIEALRTASNKAHEAIKLAAGVL